MLRLSSLEQRSPRIFPRTCEDASGTASDPPVGQKTVMETRAVKRSDARNPPSNLDRFVASRMVDVSLTLCFMPVTYPLWKDSFTEKPARYLRGTLL